MAEPGVERRGLVPRGKARLFVMGGVWFLLGVAVIWVAGWVAARLSVVLIPTGIALLLAALFGPAAGVLQRWGLPRVLAATVVLIGGLALVGGLIYGVSAAIAAGLPELRASVGETYEQLRSWLAGGPFGLEGRDLDSMVEEGRNWLNERRGSLVAGAWGVFSSVGGVLAGSVLTIFVVVFLVGDGARLWAAVVRPLPARAAGVVDRAGRRAFRDLTSYVRATVAVAFIDAIGIGLGLWITGVPLALPLAALVFIGAFVPLVGAFASGLLAVLVALVSQGPVIALIVFAIVIGVQQLEGNVFEPLLMSGAVKLHPLVVGLAVATGVHLAGIAGALLAVPLLTTVRAVVATVLNEPGPEPEPERAANENAI